MKPTTESPKKTLPKGFTIVPGLDEKYANDPFLNKKDEKAKEFIKKHGLPKELKRE